MPRLRNVLTEPVIHMLEDEDQGEGQRSACLEVEGLACDLCAARVGRALHRVPDVDRVEFDAGADRFTVRYRAGRTRDRDLAQAAAAAVIAPQVRRWIARHGRRNPAKPAPG